MPLLPQVIDVILVTLLIPAAVPRVPGMPVLIPEALPINVREKLIFFAAMVQITMILIVILILVMLKEILLQVMSALVQGQRLLEVTPIIVVYLFLMVVLEQVLPTLVKKSKIN